MLRMDEDNHGETEELSDSDFLSEDEETDDTIPLQRAKSPTKRRADRRYSPPPQKKPKVTFASIEYREHIDFKKNPKQTELYYLKIETKFKR